MRIDLAPDADREERTLARYREGEERLPPVPDTGEKGGWLLILLALLYIGPPALLLLLARIPFRLIRQIRIWTAPRAFYREHLRLYEEEYTWREKPELEFSPRKHTRRARKEAEQLEQQRQRYREQMETARTSWNGDLATAGHAFDYATYLLILNDPPAARTTLSILDQLQTQLFDPHGQPVPGLAATLTYGKLCHNLSMCLTELRLPRQAWYYAECAVQHGYPATPQQGWGSRLKRIFLQPVLLQLAWEGFESDVINCWPSPYYRRRVLTARLVPPEAPEPGEAEQGKD